METLKINQSVLGEIRNSCKTHILFEQNDHITRKLIQKLIKQFFKDKKTQGYDYAFIFNIKCDEENNTPDIVDSNKGIVTIQELENYGSSSYINHTITLP